VFIENVNLHGADAVSEAVNAINLRGRNVVLFNAAMHKCGDGVSISGNAAGSEAVAAINVSTVTPTSLARYPFAIQSGQDVTIQGCYVHGSIKMHCLRIISPRGTPTAENINIDTCEMHQPTTTRSTLTIQRSKGVHVYGCTTSGESGGVGPLDADGVPGDTTEDVLIEANTFGRRIDIVAGTYGITLRGNTFAPTAQEPCITLDYLPSNPKWVAENRTIKNIIIERNTLTANGGAEAIRITDYHRDGTAPQLLANVGHLGDSSPAVWSRGGTDWEASANVWHGGDVERFALSSSHAWSWAEWRSQYPTDTREEAFNG